MGNPINNVSINIAIKASKKTIEPGVIWLKGIMIIVVTNHAVIPIKKALKNNFF